MGNAVEPRKVDPFEIADQDPDVVGGRLQEQARENRADAHALPRAGLAGDQEVRQLRQVGDDRSARDVLTERDGELRGRALELSAFRHVADGDKADREVGDLDPDDALSRDRRLDPQCPRGERERQVVGERLDPRKLDSRRGLQLVARDDRPDEDVDDRGRDAEVREGLLDDALVADELILSRASRGALIELIDGGQNPRLFWRIRVQDAFGRNSGRREPGRGHSKRHPLTVGSRLRRRGPPPGGGARARQGLGSAG